MALPNSRVVTLSGTTTPSQLFSPNLFNHDDWIKTGLENRGFSVIAVRVSSAAWFGYQLNVEIELNVFNTFTSEEARQNAIVAIEQITANYGANLVYSNTALSVTYDAYVAPGANGGNGGNNYQNPPSNYNPPPNDRKDDFDLNTFLAGSGATVAIGGIVLLVILSRR